VIVTLLLATGDSDREVAALLLLVTSDSDVVACYRR
jgi:hypothetical protein